MKKSAAAVIALIPVVLSLLILAAHFMRDGRMILVLISLGLLIGLFHRGPVIARIVQFTLFLGTIEWVFTGWGFVQERLETGEPWIRLVIILGAVAVVAFLSGMMFFTRALKRRYYLSEYATSVSSDGGESGS